MQERKGDFLYFASTNAEQSSPHYKRRNLQTGEEQSVLDVNALNEIIDGPFQLDEVGCSVTVSAPSPPLLLL